jgi:hypothetical protein
MQINLSKSAGWSLVIAGFVLLAITGGLDWLVILVPASIILTCGIMWMSGTGDGNNNQLTPEKRKR